MPDDGPSPVEREDPGQPSRQAGRPSGGMRNGPAPLPETAPGPSADGFPEGTAALTDLPGLYPHQAAALARILADPAAALVWEVDASPDLEALRRRIEGPAVSSPRPTPPPDPGRPPQQPRVEPGSFEEWASPFRASADPPGRAFPPLPDLSGIINGYPSARSLRDHRPGRPGHDGRKNRRQ